MLVALYSIKSRAASQAGLHYANILRCIGQSLESLELKAVDVRTQGDICVVQGWHKGTSQSGNFEHQYAPADIKNLEREGRAKRNTASAPPNLLGLSHLLRFAGSYIDRMRGRLTRVSWQDQSDKIQSLTIQYEAFQGERSEHAEAQIATIEEVCIHVYKQRKKIPAAFDKPSHRSHGGARQSS